MKRNVIVILSWLLAPAAFASDPYAVDYPLDQPVALGLLKEGSGTTSTADNSGNGHTWTLNNIEEADWVTGPGGISYALDFDGVNEYAAAADSDDFSFTTGSADEPFSVAACVSFDDATNTAVLSKASAVSAIEWALLTTNDDKVFLSLYRDGYTTHQIRAYTASTITSYEGSFHHYAATYDGSGSNTGITIYIDGSSVAVTTWTLGTYTQMGNTTASVYAGAFLPSDGTYKKFLDGKMAQFVIENKEWTADEVAGLATICRQ